MLPKGVEQYYTENMDELADWYYRMCQYPFGLPDDLRSFDRFYELMTHQTTRIAKAPYGIYFITNLFVEPGVVTGHCFFWDKHILGRSKDLRGVTEHACEQYKLIRVETFIPVENKTAHILLEKAGYKCEGTMRKRILYNGKLRDIAIWAFYYENIIGNH